MRVALIDADTYVFKASTGVEVETRWDDDLWTLDASESEGWAALQGLLTDTKAELEADRIVLALSDYSVPQWRKSVMPTYKAKRTGTRKPIIYRALVQRLRETYGADVYQRPTLEGDDVLGILATHPTLVPGEKVVVSIDKDMGTVPGLHYNPEKKEPVKEVNPLDADFFHMLQTLTGDATDGYPGCPGVGPVKAEKLLSSAEIPNDMWGIVVNAYEKAGLSEAVALQNARVARICRHTDYDFKTKEVRLWSPQ